MTHHDDATWRAVAAGRPGYATYRDTKPGNPNPWRQPTLDGPRPAHRTSWRPPTRLDSLGLPPLTDREPLPPLPAAADPLADVITTWRALGEIIARVDMHPAALRTFRDGLPQPEVPGRPHADQMLGVPIHANPDLPPFAWRATTTTGRILSQGYIRPPVPDPLRSPQTVRPAAPSPAPPPTRTAQPSASTPPPPTGSAPLPPEPDTPGPQTTGRRGLDPGSPWRWLRAISPF